MGGARGRQHGVRGGRQIVHKVKVTGEQEARLQRTAAEQGVTVARLMVETVLSRGGESPAARRALFTELLRLRRDVHGLATNINQLATHANAERRFPAEAELACVPLGRAIAAIEATMRALRA